MLINFLYTELSGGTLLKICDVKHSLMELYTNFIKFYFSWKYIFPLLFYLDILGLNCMIVH